MTKLEELIFFIDNLSVSVGRSFAWCFIVLILGTCYEVFMRYGFGNPTSWAFDMSYMLYGTIFMMAGSMERMNMTCLLLQIIFILTFSSSTQNG